MARIDLVLTSLQIYREGQPNYPRFDRNHRS